MAAAKPEILKYRLVYKLATKYQLLSKDVTHKENCFWHFSYLVPRFLAETMVSTECTLHSSTLFYYLFKLKIQAYGRLLSMEISR
jgi:hypothetical protein